MSMVVIRVKCGLPWKMGCPNILQLPILDTQFPNPEKDPGLKNIIQ